MSQPALPAHSPRPSGATAVIRAERAPAVRRTLLILFALNLAVVIVKVIVAVRTRSLAVVGAAIESALDLLNNLIGMALISIAARAPDEDHPYGHEKFEAIGALAIVGFLSIACFELLRAAIGRLRDPDAVRQVSGLELAAIGAVLVVNLGVVWYERKRGRELESPFLLADAAHTSADIYVTGLTLVTLAAAGAGFAWLDPIVALVVAAIIAWNGYEILKLNIPSLVDQRAVDASEIRRVVAGIPHVSEVRAVRSRFSPSGMLFAEVTIAVDGSTPVAHSHELADAAEAALEARFGRSEVTVHVEPA